MRSPHPSSPLMLDAAAIADRLSMTAAIDALADGLARPMASVPQRLHLAVDATVDGDEQADLLVMPAAADGWAGTKTVAVVPGNPARDLPQVNASYTLLGPPGLGVVAVMDGAALTGLRTAAVSGVATRLAARDGAREVVIVGTGVQARSHLLAMVSVLPDARVTVLARRTEAFAALLDEVRAGGCDVEVRGVPVEDRAALRSADVVCLCTSSATPVVSLEDLAPGVHVNAVGAHRPDRREVSGDAVAAMRVLVGTRASALTEKGDLLLAEAEGAWTRDAIVGDLAEALTGAAQVRVAAEDRTLFASVGHASEDLIVARAIVDAG